MPFPKVSVLESVDCIVKQLKIPVQGHSKDFSRGGGGVGSHCVTPRVLTRLVCRHLRRVLLKVTFFRMSSERGGRDKPTNLQNTCIDEIHRT